MISLQEALKIIVSLKRVPETEVIPLSKSANRVLADNLHAERDYPPFNRSVKSGYAIKSEDFIDKQITKFRVISEVFAGEDKNFPLREGEAVRVSAGAIVPSDTDVVVKNEEFTEEDGFIFYKGNDFSKYKNIAVRGEHVRKNNLVISKNLMINFSHMSLMASLGKNNITVYTSPKVSVISTGNDIKPLTSGVEAYQLWESNSFSIEGFLKQYSIKPERKIIIKEDLKKLKKNIERCMDSDIIIITGGTSGGENGLVRIALKNLGFEESFDKLNIKPGKDIMFGYFPRGARVFVLPSDPFPVQVACKVLIEPFIRACFNLPPAEPLAIPLSTGRQKKINGQSGYDEFFPVELIRRPQLKINPVNVSGSGDITALARADGIAHQPADIQEVKQGAFMDFYPVNNL